MSEPNTNDVETTVVMDADAVATAVQYIAQKIADANPNMESVALMGILRRGRPLADRIAAAIGAMVGRRPQVGSLATTLYRDDLRSGRVHARLGDATHFGFDVDGITVILVDDVIAAGRTVRAALDEVMDYGRPKRIQLACLVDRGQREVPIQPDYLGWSLATDEDDHVAVRIQEVDGEDAVLLERRAQAADTEGEA